MNLPQTKSALTELAANSRFGAGIHIEPQPRVGYDGVVIGEVPYDPARHSPLDINPLSLMAEATGEQHVQLVLPNRPLDMNIVVDYGYGEDHPKIAAMKRNLAHRLETAAQSALPSITDKVYSYAIGEPDEIDMGIHYFEASSDHERATFVAGLCLEGLTFVLSDFRHLPLAELSQADLSGGVAVKVNHPSERALPANVGVIALGGGKEVNTSNTKQLNNWNRELAERHEQIVRGLNTAGMSVAGAVYTPSLNEGFSVASVDEQLAQAVTAYAKSKH